MTILGVLYYSETKRGQMSIYFKHSQESIDFLRLSWPDKSNSTQDIAKILNLSEGTIRHYCCDNQIKREKNLSYQIYDDYFKTVNKNSAWILGFILADGNIQKDRNCLDINIHSKDREIVDFIKSELKTSSTVKNRSKNQVRLTVYSKEIKDDLAKFGIIPAKTGKEIFPKLIPHQYKWDFIRGVFDGDGCATRDQINIVSANPNFLFDIQKFVGCGYVKSHLHGKNYLYVWNVYSRKNIKYIYENFYGHPCFFLKRKKDKMLRVSLGFYKRKRKWE